MCYLPFKSSLLFLVGLAQETLLHLVDEKQQFDLVFIDANKDGYLEYFKVTCYYSIHIKLLQYIHYTFLIAVEIHNSFTQ